MSVMALAISPASRRLAFSSSAASFLMMADAMRDIVAGKVHVLRDEWCQRECLLGFDVTSDPVQARILGTNISWSSEAVVAFCQKHGIARLAIFGSATRETFTENSDIDILVVFKPGRVPGLFGLARMERELSTTVFHGRKVDMRTPDDLSRYFRDDVIASAVPIHEEG